MSDVLNQFAALLANEPPIKREALLARAKMLAMQEAPAEAFEPPITTLGEYLATPIDIPPSLVWPTLVVRGEITATLGASGKGKTTYNLVRILRWAAGLPLFDTFHCDEGHYLAPAKPLRTLIIENEGAAGMFHQKVGTMLRNSAQFSADQEKMVEENVLIWGDGGYSGLKLDEPAMLNNVRAGCEKHKPDVVFVEPFRSLWKGEENSSTDMAVIVDNLIGLATDFGCGIILSHHERKGGAGEDDLMRASRGSTVLEGAVAVMENFQSTKGGDFREITWSKARYLQPPPATRMQYDCETLWYRHILANEIENEILRTLEENDDMPMSVKDFAGELNENQNKLRPLLKTMTDEGRLKKMGSTSGPDGSTGYRYRLATSDNGEGLGF